MALWECEGCGCQYSVGAPACPECGNRKSSEVGAQPKGKKAGSKPADDKPAGQE